MLVRNYGQTKTRRQQQKLRQQWRQNRIINKTPQADILFKNKGMETGYSVQKILEELSREEILR